MLVLTTASGILSTSVICFIIFEAKVVRVWVHDDVQFFFISPEAYTHFTLTILFCLVRTRRVVFLNQSLQCLVFVFLSTNDSVNFSEEVFGLSATKTYGHKFDLSGVKKFLFSRLFKLIMTVEEGK